MARSRKSSILTEMSNRVFDIPLHHKKNKHKQQIRHVCRTCTRSLTCLQLLLYIGNILHGSTQHTTLDTAHYTTQYTTLQYTTLLYYTTIYYTLYYTTIYYTILHPHDTNGLDTTAVDTTAVCTIYLEWSRRFLGIDKTYVCVYMYIYIYIYTYICMYVYIRIRMYVCIAMYTYSVLFCQKCAEGKSGFAEQRLGARGPGPPNMWEPSSRA
jgi:hypothetical protein